MPRYSDPQPPQPVQVHVQLRRPSDGQTSDPLPFYLTPTAGAQELALDLEAFHWPAEELGLETHALLDISDARLRY